MAWIESHDTLKDHHKTRKAARLLGVSIPAMIGHLHLLWHWCLTFAEEGDLTGYDAHDIADAMMWEGEPQALVDALLNCGREGKAGFLAHGPDGSLLVHDWWDYAGQLIKTRQESAESGARGNHIRWHVKRGITSPTCEFCQAESQDDRQPIGGRSGGDENPNRVLSHRNLNSNQIDDDDARAREEVHKRLQDTLLWGHWGPHKPVLDDYADEFGWPLVLDVMNRTLEHSNNRSWKYAKKIFDDWHRRGVKSLADVAVLDAEHEAGKRRRAPPEKEPPRYEIFDDPQPDWRPTG